METETSTADYKKDVLIQTLVNDFKCMGNLCLTLKADSLVKQIDDILHRIASDSFSIAVVGEFKRGKSTFINALSGKNFLPSDVLPATATLNRITYSPTPSAKIIFRDGRS